MHGHMEMSEYCYQIHKEQPCNNTSLLRADFIVTETFLASAVNGLL